MFNAREDIISFFEKGIFLFKGNVFKTKEEIKQKTNEEIERFISNDIALIERESEGINNDLFKKHFEHFQHLLIWQKNYLKEKMQIKKV